MAKHSKEFKLIVVQTYLSNTLGYKKTGEQFNLCRSTVQKWVAIYHSLGEDGLSVKKTKENFSPEFKLKVILSIINDGFSNREAAKYFQLREHVLICAWLRQYRKYGIEGLQPKPKGRLKQMPKPQQPRIKTSQEDRNKTQEQLLDEIAYLRAEVAYLKKRRALIQKQKEQEKAEQQRLQASYLN